MTPTIHRFEPPARRHALPVVLDERGSSATEAAPDVEPLRVVIAEGQGLVRAGFRALLERQDAIVVAAEAATGDEAVAAARAARPDVVLVDLDLRGTGGLEAAREILDEAPAGETRVVMLTTSASDDALFGALRAGATGLLLKDTEPDELVSAVRIVARGEAVLAPTLARRLVGDFLSRPERLRSTPEQLEELTPREREVVALVAYGLSNDEIAERLVITHATAKTHVSRALRKLHARDRAQLVALAYEVGLVRAGPDRAVDPDQAAAASTVTKLAPHRRMGIARRARLEPLAA
jgi:DNA-binding NarL/FixJ family response regulator